jgi:pimeloyl-ACP methyl ester carboxylesterase
MSERHDSLLVDGKHLEYAWLGPPPEEAPTLVLLHDGLGCVDLWRDFPARLAQATGWGCLVYSRAGYGGSDPCELPRSLRYMHNEALQVLPQLLQETRVRDCILVGHSDGGSIALIYAGTVSDARLRGLITEAAHVFNEDICVASIERSQQEYATGELRERLVRYHGDNTDCAFRGWCDAWLDPGFRAWNLEEFLPEIRVPWLVIQGEDDAYGTDAQVEAIARGAEGPVQVRLLSECGHTPHRDQPEITLDLMVDFVRGSE